MDDIYKNKNKLKRELFNYLYKYGDKIKEKLRNVCGKTGQYYVPTELFQVRTSRSNRVLIPWKNVRDNNLSIEELKSFEGGVVVEFINNDYFDLSNKNNPVFSYLVNKIGSNEKVSAIISMRSEDGEPSQVKSKEAFDKLISNTHIKYRDSNVIITKDNYMNYVLKQNAVGGTGNEKWSGFLFISIRGGNQEIIEALPSGKCTIFNPACEYASKDVCLDINLVVSYFMMKSIDFSDNKTLDYINNLKEIQNDRNKLEKLKNEYNNLIIKLEETLSLINYNSPSYKGDLLSYCKSHMCLRLGNDRLIDTIQVKPITIKEFNNEKIESFSIDLTHSEAVNKGKYYWDLEKKCILSPARPSNLFWSYHISNMMQQDYTLKEFFDDEKRRYEERNLLLKKEDNS